MAILSAEFIWFRMKNSLKFDFEFFKQQKGIFKLIQLVYFLIWYLWYCQSLYLSFSLSISQSLNLSLSLRDRDRADTIISTHHRPPATGNSLRTLELTYTQVWSIIGIVFSSPSYFCIENIGLIGVTIHSVIGSRDVYLAVDFVSQSVRLGQSIRLVQPVRLG